MRWNGEDLFKSVLLGVGSGTSGGGSGGGGSSGGATGVSPKEVNFYDYDGTCVHAYTVEEAQALTELPAGPEHPGLVFQGWNWSFEGVKGLTRAMNIGAMYTTDDGTTRLYITLQEGRTSPMLGVGVNGTVTVDWGDGTEPDVLTGTNINTTKWTPNHAYAKPGDYVIRLTVDGAIAFTGASSSNQYACILRHASANDVRNHMYHNALRRVEVGDNVEAFNDYAFYGCYLLASITIPKNVASFGACAFYNCYHLKHVPLPDEIAIASEKLFYYCYDLASVAMPNSTKDIGQQAFASCFALSTVTIPDGVTCIYSKMFYSCHNITYLIIPRTVNAIEAYAFQQITGMVFCDFTSHTTVPELLNTNAFSGIPDDCEIRVPAALYDEWIAATNWTTYADRIKAY